MPSVDFNKLLSGLKNKEYAPVYFLFGNEDYFIDRATEYFESKILKESEQAFNQTVRYGKDTKAEMVLDAARRLPLMAPVQVVILKEAQEMKDLNELLAYVENPAPSTVLCIAFKHKKLDMRTKFGQALKKHAVVFESKKLYDNQVLPWISNYLRERNYNIEPEALQLIVEQLGTELGKITIELDKLILNVPEGKSISPELVERYVGISREYNVFEFQKALGLKLVNKAFKIQQYFSTNQKSHPLILILGSLYNYFSKLYVLKGIPYEDDKTVASALGLGSTFFVKEYKAAGKRYTLEEIEQVLQLLSQYDLRSKGVNNHSTEKGELLRELTYKILTSKDLYIA